MVDFCRPGHIYLHTYKWDLRIAPHLLHNYLPIGNALGIIVFYSFFRYVCQNYTRSKNVVIIHLHRLRNIQLPSGGLKVYRNLRM